MNEVFLEEPGKINCSFMSTLQEAHGPKGTRTGTSEKIIQAERVFLSLFGLGVFETYHFLYNECKDLSHFESWIINLKGYEFCKKAAEQFNKWHENAGYITGKAEQVLTQDQLSFWAANGYLKIEQLIDSQRCDAVINMVLEYLHIDLQDPLTWYPVHEKLQGMMLQLYQHPALENIRSDENVKKVFACLYDQNDIIPDCEKVSYNPPETSFYKFKGSPLHWDIDFDRGPQYYIQGVLYLNDVPVKRGPLSLIPGFHLHLKDYLKKFDDPEHAIESLRKEKYRIVPVTGKQGDLILWHQALPHAALPNHCNMPRFAQYLSFTKL